ncbi:hypothetical protein D3C85_1447420 [compost metagenome]
MGIAHRHGDGRVPEYLLQHQNVTAVHHKMAGKGVPQHVGALPCRQLNACLVDGRFKVVVTLAEQLAPAFGDDVDQLLVDGHGSALATLGVGESQPVL